MDYKIVSLGDMKITSEEGVLKLKGYANTKNIPDRYGDIPTALPSRGFVYDLKEFEKNPVMLLNHNNSIENIAGSFDVFREDEKGLYVEASFSNSDLPNIAHARKVFEEGHARALSISGRWQFENKANPNQLTLAEIFEISLVAVPADPNAIISVDRQKAFEDALGKIGKVNQIKEIEKADTIRDVEEFLEKKGCVREESRTVISKIKAFLREADSKVERDAGLMNELKKLNELIKGK